MNARVLEISKLLVKEILRKKDFYVALVLTALILFYAAQLRFFGVTSASRYLIDLGLVLGFFFGVFLTVSLAARQFPNEVREKTFHVLMAHPVSRTEYLLGKFFGVWFSGALVSLVFFGALVVVTLTKASSFEGLLAFQTYFVFVLGLGVLTAFTIVLSLVLTPASAVSIVVSFYGLMNLYGFYWSRSAAPLPLVSKWFSLALCYTVPHLEFFDMRERFVHVWPPLSPGLLLFLRVYAAGYSALFLLVGRFLLSKKSIS